MVKLKDNRQLRNSKEFIFASIIAHGTGKQVAYKILFPHSKASNTSLGALASKFSLSEKVLDCVEFIENEIKEAHTKIEYVNITDTNIRDKDRMLLEINHKLDINKDPKLDIEYRKLVSDLLQMKKEETTQDHAKPILYMPDKQVIIDACIALDINPQKLISKLDM